MPKNKTIQEKIDELNELVAWFDSDEFTLEEAVTKFKAAETLAEDIKRDLAAFKNDINVLKQRFDEV